jgi:transcriptional regulator with XRE-family HTH domain
MKLTDKELFVLKRTTEQLGVTYRELAELIDVSQSVYSNRMRGKTLNSVFTSEQAKTIYERLGEPEELSFLIGNSTEITIENVEKLNPLNDAYLRICKIYVQNLLDAAEAMTVDDKKTLIGDLEGFVNKYTNNAE